MAIKFNKHHVTNGTVKARVFYSVDNRTDRREPYRDEAIWKTNKEREDAERSHLSAVSSNWDSIIERLNDEGAI